MRGEISPVTGFVMDFHEIDRDIKPLISKLDHSHLNDTIDNPTAENIASWILERIPRRYAFSVTIWESEKCWAQVVNADGMYKRGHME